MGVNGRHGLVGRQKGREKENESARKHFVFRYNDGSSRNRQVFLITRFLLL